MVALACDVAAAPVTRPHHRLDVTLSRTAPHIRGTVETTFTNRGAHSVDALVFVLFANRFATPDTGVTDVNRPFVYPYEEFDPGSMTVQDVLIDGALARVAALTQPGVPDGCLLRVALPRPLAPGATAAVRVSFETTVPTRFGSFGRFEGMLTAVGGWYPSLAAPRPDGTWEVHGLPELADFDVRLRVEPELAVVLNGQEFGHPDSPIHAEVRGCTISASSRRRAWCVTRSTSRQFGWSSSTGRPCVMTDAPSGRPSSRSCARRCGGSSRRARRAYPCVTS